MRLAYLTAAFAVILATAAPAQETPPQAAPDAPAPAALEPRSFTIFFDHSGPQIPDEAQALLPQIAEIYTRVGYKAVAVECHSDNVASQAINVPLTEDRARRIKTELVRYGVPEAAVTAVGLGFSDPLVPDAPLDTTISNRRCVIALT